MPIWGNTDVVGQNSQVKVNRSGPTHYDIGMSLHYAYGVYRSTYHSIEVIQYLDRERWIKCFLVKHASVKSVPDQMNHKLHSLVFCVRNNFLCIIFLSKIIRDIDAYMYQFRFF